MKAFTDIFIKNKVYSLAITIAIFLIGVIAYNRLPLRQYPVIDLPVITITTTYPGANPDIMEGFVSTPIEQALAGLIDVDYITAENTQGQSVITIWLKDGSMAPEVLTKVNTRVNSVMWQLPKGILDPSITEGSPGNPCLYIAIGSNTASSGAIHDYIIRAIMPKFDSVTGVQDLKIYSATYAMRLWLDPYAMTAHHVTADDVINAVNNNTLQAGIGIIRGPLEEFSLNSNASLVTAKEFNKLVINHHGNTITRIRDIGYAKLGEQEASIASRAEGYKYSAIIAVVPHDKANNIEVTNTLLSLLPEIKSKLPPNMHLKVLWNPTKFSEASVKLVYDTIWQSVLLVVIIIFLFLGTLRALLIPIITIPLSLIGVCGIMLALGYSLNVFTLLAFVLAIGLVVDDSIVVLENIHRHMQLGVNSFKAAIDATREIAIPVIAMTLVVAVVFVPIALTQGLTGKLFREFGLTLSMTVLLSGLFALILSPMMCSELLKSNTGHQKFSQKIDHIMEAVETRYKNMLSKLVNSRVFMILVYLVVLIIFVVVFLAIPHELLPSENQGVILGIGIAPTSASKYYLNDAGNKMAKIFSKIKEAEDFGIVRGFGGPTNLIAFVVLRDHQKGDRTESQLISYLQPRLGKIAMVQAFPMNRPQLADVTGLTSPVQFVLQTYGSYSSLYSATNKLMALIKQNPKIVDIRSDLKINKPQIKVNINRDRAADLGVPINEITDTLGIFLGQPMIGWFALDGESYPIIPQAIRKYRLNPQDIYKINVRTASGKFVTLSNLVTLQQETVPQSLNQFQQLRSATIDANLQHGYTLGQALDYIRHAAQHVMSHNMQYDYAGTSRRFVQASGALEMIFIIVLAAVYLMLAIKFNSFVDPLIVMLSVPLAITGALIAMHWAGYTMNIYTQIGLIMLVGLISKHGILIVNFANHLQEEGYSIKQAAIEASRIRLRPILMTSAAMVFGAIPLAVASGDGSESLRQIGLVIIAGLGLGSLMTLFILPTFYCMMASKVVDHNKIPT